MIPVYYDEINEVWKKADSTNQDRNYKWYDYCEKKWANSVTVTSSSRSTYLNAGPGTTIDMDDILTMQVWIPRYKYKVWNYNADGTVTGEPQEIEIVFEEGRASTGEITCTDNIQGEDGDGTSEICRLKSTNAICTDDTCNNKYYTHPAFTFGEEELTGFWIGKFELTGEIDNITIKPDLSSVRGQKVGGFSTNIMSMNDSGNQYGFSTNIDTHMIKNMEWGAVAYLSHSKYGTCDNGICREVYMNNSSGFYTGRSGGNTPGSTQISGIYPNQTSDELYNTYGYYTYDGYLLEYGTNIKSETRDLSKVASTTGNIYGVYDMSGGAWEYSMANSISPDGITMMSGQSTTSNSGYMGIIYDGGNYTSYTGEYLYPLDKYYDKYSFGTRGGQRKLSKLGDSIKEVFNTTNYGWYTDYNFVPASSVPWIAWSGNYAYGFESGIFSSTNSNGLGTVGYISSRMIIAILE